MRWRHTVLLLAAGLTLPAGGCMPTPSLVADEKPVQQQVQLVERGETIDVTTRRGGFDDEALTRIRELVLRTGDAYGVYVNLYPGERMSRADLSPVLATLAAAGVQKHNIRIDDSLRGARGILGVRAAVYAAVTPACVPINRTTLLASQDRNAATAEAPPPPIQFGCVSTANFGMMLADPRELVAPRPYGGLDGDAALSATRQYKAGAVPSLGGTSSSSGGSALGAASQ